MKIAREDGSAHTYEFVHFYLRGGKFSYPDCFMEARRAGIGANGCSPETVIDAVYSVRIIPGQYYTSVISD